MHQAFLLLGSNQGDRTRYLTRAIEALGSIGQVSLRSSLYETEAWGLTDQPPFLNQAVGLSTTLPPEDLLRSILEIEKQLGRERLLRYGPRTIDIDILLYDSLEYQTDRLTIPHPELPNRRFALTALNEIASRVIHPTLQRSVGELLKACQDPLVVKQVQEAD